MPDPPVPPVSHPFRLAGWHPDTTFWLRDVLQPSGEPSDWRLQESEVGGAGEWHPLTAAF